MSKSIFVTNHSFVTISESILYSVLFDFLTIRDSGKPFFGYAILFDCLNLDEYQTNVLRILSENHSVSGSIEKSTDALLEEWLKIIGDKIQTNEGQ